MQWSGHTLRWLLGPEWHEVDVSSILACDFSESRESGRYPRACLEDQPDPISLSFEHVNEDIDPEHCIIFTNANVKKKNKCQNLLYHKLLLYHIQFIKCNAFRFCFFFPGFNSI